jgi:release factor glutamine methyltransferase
MAVTYNELYLEARRALRECGVIDDQLEARELICYVSGKTRQEFLRDRNLYTSHEIEEQMAWLLRRRQAGEPVAYLLGEWGFMGLTLDITSDVLIPRPDTEVLAEQAILRAQAVKKSCRVLDLCCGSGCIGLAVAKYVPGCRVILGDYSDGALRIAKQNVRKTGLKSQIGCSKMDALREPPYQIGTFDVIVSNPPYIRTAEMETLDASVKDYEPHMALDGGEDGLDFYRSIARQWKHILRPNGALLFEVGYDQAQDVAELMEEAGFRDVACHKDGNDILRVVEGTLA